MPANWFGPAEDKVHRRLCSGAARSMAMCSRSLQQATILDRNSWLAMWPEIRRMLDYSCMQ